MGLFDYLRCYYPLEPEGANDYEFQTKDTSAQYMDHYEIRKDGTLWHEEYDVEDRSDPKATGIEALRGCMTPINKRWVQEKDFTGEIGFGVSLWQDPKEFYWPGSLEYSAYFLRGVLQQINLIENTLPQKRNLLQEKHERERSRP